MKKILGFFKYQILSLENRFGNKMGYIYGISSHIFFVFTSLSIKINNKNLATSQLVQAISLLLIIQNHFVIKANNLKFYETHPTINQKLVLRGILGFLAAIGWFSGVKLLPLSEAIVVCLLFPAFTALIAYIMLDEKYEANQAVNTIICFIGVILIVKPGFIFGYENNDNVNGGVYKILGIIACLGNALSVAIANVAIKSLGGKVSPFVISNYVGFFGGILAPLLMIYEGVKEISLDSIPFILMIGLFSYTAQVLHTRAYVFEKAGKIAITGYTQVAFSFIMDIFILDYMPNLFSIIGTLCISTSIIFMLYFQKPQAGKLLEVKERNS